MKADHLVGFRNWRDRTFAPASARDVIAALQGGGDCRSLLDLGCGALSPVSSHSVNLFRVGVENNADAFKTAQAAGTHHVLIESDILDLTPQRLQEASGTATFDIVVALDVIEHLPRSAGSAFLKVCEDAASKYVVIQTPNGFQQQGPEFGNEGQRHLSGWYPNDFRARGYVVHGTTGTRLLRGYAAGLRYSLRGLGSLDRLMSKMLWIERHPRLAYNILAIKDMRGARARLGPR